MYYYQSCTEDFTDKLFFKPKHSSNSIAHPHKNYAWIQSELEFCLVIVSTHKWLWDCEIVRLWNWKMNEVYGNM